MASVLNLEDLSESTDPVSLASQLAIVILTAGRGSRMRSSTPKVLHPLVGLPMIEHVVRAAESLHPLQLVMVTGPTSVSLNDIYSSRCDLAWQAEPLGTGHAVLSALPHFSDRVKWVMVLFGDHPLTDPQTLHQMIQTVTQTQALVTLLGAELDHPGAYARIQMDGQRVTGVLEARDDPADYASSTRPVLINSGICCFQRAWLEEHLPDVPASASGEIYLTSLIEVAARTEHLHPVAHVVGRAESAYGVNTRVELAEAERILRDRINRSHMLAGVTLVDPASTYIDADVEIGEDTRIEPGCAIRRGTIIGRECQIGPQSLIVDSKVAERVTIAQSTVESAEIGPDVDIGPFAHLRPGTRIAHGTHIGNYVEMKNASIGPHSAVGHFSYLGDAEIGRNVNVGAGTITCNFDGVTKHRSIVGDGVFLGSDTLLVAPVELGDDSRTGAGSVVNKDVPAGATVVGVPARLIRRRSQE